MNPCSLAVNIEEHVPSGDPADNQVDEERITLNCIRTENMTENRSFGGLFGSKDPDLNISVSGTAPLSPYMNLDPRLIQDDSNYIVSEESGQHNRGKFEKAFAQIGGFIFTGAILGGVNGVYTGLKETRGLQGSVKRTQMLNFIAKQGASSAQAFGTVAFIYSALDTILSKAGSPDEDLNTMIAGTTTGILYKSTAGLKGVRVGGLAGLAFSGLFCLVSSSRSPVQLSFFK